MPKRDQQKGRNEEYFVGSRKSIDMRSGISLKGIHHHHLDGTFITTVLSRLKRFQGGGKRPLEEKEVVQKEN